VKYLNRHPSETDLTLDQIAEVAMIGQEIEKHQVEMMGALFGGK
jgi:hypothetical protein